MHDELGACNLQGFIRPGAVERLRREAHPSLPVDTTRSSCATSTSPTTTRRCRPIIPHGSSGPSVPICSPTIRSVMRRRYTDLRPQSRGDLQGAGHGARAMMQIDELLDLKRYPLDRPGSDSWNELVESCRAMHEKDGCANLPGFILPDALPALADEAQGLLTDGYRKSHLRTALFNHGDPSKPQGHSVRRTLSIGSISAPTNLK